MGTQISAERTKEIAKKAADKRKDTQKNRDEERQKKVTDLYRKGWDFIFGKKKLIKKDSKETNKTD